VVHDTVWRGILRDFLGAERPLQKADQRLGPPRMQTRIHAEEPLRNVALAFVSCYVPEVAGLVLHRAGALTVLLIARLVHQSRSRLHRSPGYRVHILYVVMQSIRLQRS